MLFRWGLPHGGRIGKSPDSRTAIRGLTSHQKPLRFEFDNILAQGEIVGWAEQREAQHPVNKNIVRSP
jgi:hypothetical protein